MDTESTTVSRMLRGTLFGRLVGVLAVWIACGPPGAFASEEIIRLRSGMVGGQPGEIPTLPNVGPVDDNVHYWTGQSCGSPLSVVPFTPPDFVLARGGGNAELIVPHTAPTWIQSLPSDPDARWINWNHGLIYQPQGSGNPPASVLYAHDFFVGECITEASIDFWWAVDDRLGDPDGGPNTIGVYINGVPLSANFRGPGAGAEYFASQGGIEDLLIPGATNTLYVYQRDMACAVSGIIFSARITIQQGCRCVEPPEGMVAWWTLDETGTNRLFVEDSVGGHTGTRINAPTPVVGKVDVALEFNGVDDYVNVPHDAELNVGNDVSSIDVLVKLILNRNNPIVSKVDADGRGYTFGVNAANLPYLSFMWGANTEVQATAPVPDDGDWHCLGVSIPWFVQGRPPPCQLQVFPISFYIDGVPAGTVNIGLSSCDNFANGGSLWIGRDEDEYLQGTLDELTLYDRDLTEDEFQSICDGGSQGKCKCPCGDLDGDGDVDLEDFAKFQACFTGPLP